MTTHLVEVTVSSGCEFMEIPPQSTTTGVAIICDKCGRECHVHYFSIPALDENGRFRWETLCPDCNGKESE
jgi:hypothetical protein